MVGHTKDFPRPKSVRSSASTASLDSTQSTTTGAATRHDPYATPSAPTPEGTYHTALTGKVTFVSYPTSPFFAPDPPSTDGDLVRVFIGQLPYFVTDMQLSWLCATFAGGRAIANPERIMKKRADGTRQPTGCLHGYVTAADADALCDRMNKRLLIDETGVWFAQNKMEQSRLAEYLATLRKSRRKRLPNRPYDAVVVQLATSTYVPLEPMPLTEMPAEDTAPKPGAAMASAVKRSNHAHPSAQAGRHQQRQAPSSKRPPQVHREVLSELSFAPAPYAQYAPAVHGARPYTPPMTQTPPPPSYAPGGYGIASYGMRPPPPPYYSDSFQC